MTSHIAQKILTGYTCSIIQFTVFARSALYVRAHSQNWNVRPFVRSFVRIFSDFCEEDMRGGHMPLPLGVLNYEFEGFEKNEKKCSKCTYQWDLLSRKIRFWIDFGELF